MVLGLNETEHLFRNKNIIPPRTPPKLVSVSIFLVSYSLVTFVNVLVAAGGISSWTTFLREEEDSKKSKEDH
jgi:hypothetical protein